MRINNNYLAIFVGMTVGLAAGCSTKKSSGDAAGGRNDGGSGGAPATPVAPASPVCAPTGSSGNATAGAVPDASGTAAASAGTPAPAAAAAGASGGVIAQTTLNLADPGSTTTTGNAVPIAATTSGTGAVAGTSGGTTAVAATPSTCVGNNATPAPATTPTPAATANTTGSANAGGTDATQAGNTAPIGPVNFGSKVTLTSCTALKKAWIPSSDGSAMCGDPLVSWCCNAQTVAQEFPGSAAALQQAFDKYTSAGSVMYQCSLGTGLDQTGKSVPQYNFYFFKSSSTGFNMGSVFIQNATPAQPNAAACPAVTPAQIGLTQ